ncbi:unnamed protein product [Microthlaspi erraticum]|uniref:Uncharacterized protein n=1 Tax=Microthlaspi erraticum TaxID=1685480 RepID=A0A6D2JK69_9BRAS|nr:unnamed protein product [Microthlaspi erraticum]CAA7039523.1 unnamed protein product [Microthlaspi erraticum]
MGRPKGGTQRRKTKSQQATEEPVYVGYEKGVNDTEDVLNEDRIPEESHVEEDMQEAGLDEAGIEDEVQCNLTETEPKRKKQRGPTKMKYIAKDPNCREKVDFTDLGEPIGSGSVKLSSYLGPLVREHVPVIIDGWRKISEELKTVLRKSVQQGLSLMKTTKRISS